ncbi:MAG: hypothetical protein JWM04_769 [Verrucomicrobiales bacterium]|nr:hypothetical protein [Verrucomicrobiales bacterium]
MTFGLIKFIGHMPPVSQGLFSPYVVSYKCLRWPLVGSVCFRIWRLVFENMSENDRSRGSNLYRRWVALKSGYGVDVLDGKRRAERVHE